MGKLIKAFQKRYKNESLFLQKKIIYLLYTNHIFILAFSLFTILNIFTTDYFIALIIGFGTFLYLVNYFLIYKKNYELATNITLLLPMIVVGLDMFLAKNDTTIGFHIAYRGTVSFFTMMLIMSLIAVRRYQPIMISMLSAFIIAILYIFRFLPNSNSMDAAVIINIGIHYILAGTASFLVLYLTEDLLNITQEKSQTAIQATENLQKSYIKLSEEKEKQSKLLAALPDLIIIHDHEGNVKDFSLTNNELIQLFQEKVPIHNIFEILPNDSKTSIKDNIKNIKEKDELRIFDFELENKSKEKIFFEARINPLDESTFVFIGRDISEKVRSNFILREAEDRIFQTSKMATLGELSAGIAHEINQPLNYLNGVFHLFSNFDQNEKEIHNKINKYIPNSIHSLDRINSIVNHLRDFVRSQESEKSLVDLNKIINNSLIFFKEKIRLKNIRLTISQKDTDYNLYANQNRLEQVFVNLFQNSIDALEAVDEHNRQINIIINKKLENEICNLHIRFFDNGTGIDESANQKIFEPFFTTKRILEGTGLGLSIASTIIKEHGGTIELSENKKGTEFLITFQCNQNE